MGSHTISGLSMNLEFQKGHHTMFPNTLTMPGGHFFPTTSTPTKRGTGKAFDHYQTLSHKPTIQIMKQTK